MSDPAHLTDCGLPGIRQVPYGVHMCHFYEGRDDLADTLVPYFAAGLRGNERCIWITADPLDQAQARVAMQEAGLDPAAEERKGSLTLRTYSDWYTDAGEPRLDGIVERWFAEEQRALARGFNGLRVTGNASFMTPQTWPLFMDYEGTLNQALQGRRIVTLCSYRLGLCGPAEVLEVVQRHHCTLDRPDLGWQMLTRGSPPELHLR